MGNFLMNILTKIHIYLWITIVASLPALADESLADCQIKEATPKVNIALYDKIIINRPVKEVWTELLNYPIWFFSGKGIERIKGELGHIGYTIVGNGLYTQVIGVRPLQSIVWKISPISNDERDYVFIDYRVEGFNGKTRLSRSYYSQGFWSDERLQGFIQDQSQGRTPEFIEQNSLAFKAYMEKGVTYEDYIKKQKAMTVD